MEKSFINTIQNLPFFAERASQTENGNDIDEQIDSIEDNKQDDIGIDPSGSSSLFLNQKGEWASNLIGPCGPMGPTGPTGPTGPCGPLGFCGPKGFCGPSGAKGATGPTGPCGPLGFCGPKGFCGPFGNTGSQGDKGSNSTITGPFGNTGSRGDTGVAETGQGPGGATGFCGPRGSTNNTAGLRGYSGPQGFCGPKGNGGDRGNSGPCGPSGPRGADGLNGTLYQAAASGTSWAQCATTQAVAAGQSIMCYYAFNNNSGVTATMTFEFDNGGTKLQEHAGILVKNGNTVSGTFFYRAVGSAITAKLWFRSTSGSLTGDSGTSYMWLLLP